MKEAIQQTAKRRKYDKRFKEDAVNRVIRTGKSCNEVGRELGIKGNILSRWRRQYLKELDEHADCTDGIKPGEMAEQLREAHKEIADLRDQRDILKKALSIFSRRSESAGRW